ncbi:MAG: EamA family transporter [Terriglobia bacterium]|nr:MAG: EamA family transporter [Terriglobia bacterium]
MSRRVAEAALAGNTIVWGSTFVLVKSALANVSPLLFLALRFSLASLILVALFGRGLRIALKGAEVRAGILIGCFLFSGYLLQTLGLRLTSAPKSAFLTGLGSVMVPLLAMAVYRNRPQVSELLGVLVATVGLGLMTLEGPVTAINRGDLLTVGCALAFAAHIVTLGHYSEEMRFEVLSILQVVTSAALALALFAWVEPPRLAWQPAVIYAVLITGFLATAAAFTVQAWAQRYTTSTRTALIYTLEPVFAWITSYWLVGEGLSRRAAAGAALIMGGVLLVELKPLNLKLHPSK